MKDLEDEKDPYYKVDDSLSNLLSWTSVHFSTYDSAFLDLILQLVSAGFHDHRDPELARAWCSDLRSAGYSWPYIRERLPKSEAKQTVVVDESFEPIFTSGVDR